MPCFAFKMLLTRLRLLPNKSGVTLSRCRAFSAVHAQPPREIMEIRNSLRDGERTLFIQPDGKPLTWYSCGPTVYDSAHLGHARTYICTDVLRRILVDYHSVDMYYAMGITDIDDKIIQRAKDSGKNWRDLAAHFEAEFKEDMRSLNVLPPDAYLPVTDHIPGIIDYIQGVIDSGYAYVADDGVYFSVNKLGDRYACLGHTQGGTVGLDVEESSSVAQTGKRNVKDFALWKVNVDDSTNHPSLSHVGPAPSWDSPWGEGRPGWHIECSAMTHACFGSSLDVHSGGIDLLFPHHTNEVAQCTAHNNCSEWTKFWVHTGHLHIDGCKMSKSLKNFISIKEYLAAGWTSAPADDLRIYFLSHKYHSTLHFARERIEEAAIFRNRIENFLELVKKLRMQEDVRSISRWKETADTRALRQRAAEVRLAMSAALRDDFNTPTSMRLVSDLVLAALPVVRASLVDFSIPAQSIFNIEKIVTSTLSTFGLKFFKTNQQDITGQELSTSLRESFAIDKFVEFRSDVRNVCVKELKAAKRRKREARDFNSLDGEEQLLGAIRDTLAACDAVRSEVFSEVGLSISDAPTADTVRCDDKKKISNSWHFVDSYKKSSK